MNSDNSQIVYCLVAHGSIILAEYTEKQGNFDAVTRQLLPRIDVNENKIMSYVYPKERYVFHYMVDNRMTYLCLAQEGFGRIVAFRFLEDIKNKFISRFDIDRAQRSQEYSLNADFKGTIKKCLLIANDRSNMTYRQTDNKINQINEEIEKTKNTVMESIEKVLDRGDKLELLLEKSDNLQESSRVFKGNANKLKRRMLCKNIKMTLLLILIVIVVAYAVFAIFCGFDGSSCFN